MNLPSGTVAFLFTDIEGSTRLWEADPDDMARRIAAHDQIINDLVLRHDGTVFSSQGDSFAAAFHTPADATAAAVDAQLSLRDVLAIRMAVHVGPVESRSGDYFGPTLNRCGRLRDAAHGGQIICSQAVVDLLGEDFDGVELTDLGEHRLRDMGRPERIHQVTHRDLPGEFPPLDTVRVESTNLPIQVTSFIGRDQEMAEIDKLLRASRLVTLTGAGGCGKSRLAMETAAGLLDEFPDGVWLVELASVDASDLVASALASVLGVQERPNTTLTDALVTYLKSRRLLLIVDNCEHVLDALTPLVHAVITGTPAVRVLATSREPLHTHGEATYPVPPLPLAEPEDDADPIAVSHAGAVRLFIERAAAVLPDFHLTSDTAPTVASICRHLDGIPLAIELAAATVRLLPVTEVASRLDDRFRLLRHGVRDSLPHHRTLEAAIAWSYDHLTADQQTLLAQLSVFEGGWTLDAAEHICVAGPVHRDDVASLLTDLVDRSLVGLVEEKAGRRYRLLETISVYAAGRPGSDPELRRRHADFYLAFAERIEPLLSTEGVTEGVAALDAELPNIRRVFGFLREAGDLVAFARLLVALRLYLYITRKFTEADQYFDFALSEMDEADLEPGLAGRVLLAAGKSVGRGYGRKADVEFELIGRSIPLLEKANDDTHLSEALTTFIMKDPAYAQRAIEAARRSGDEAALARPYHYLGLDALLHRGDLQEAVENFERAHFYARATNVRTFAQLWLATVKYRLGDIDEAHAMVHDALARFESIDDAGGIYTSLQLDADIHLSLDDSEGAWAAIDRHIRIRDADVDAGALATAADAAARSGRHDDACHLLSRARVCQGIELMMEDHVLNAFLAVAHLALQNGEPTSAAHALGAHASYRSSHDILPCEPREEYLAEISNRIRTVLAVEEFDSAWQHGLTLTLGDVVDLALELDRTWD